MAQDSTPGTQETTSTRQRQSWEARWSQENFKPRWGGRGVPPEVKQAIENGWLPGRGRLLDIGCGIGELTAGLHRLGYECLGIDIAEAAIQRAIVLHSPSNPQLRFEACDICANIPLGGPFDILIDRGCLHGIPEALFSAYARNVASAGRTGARMLIFMRISRRGGRLARLPGVRAVERFLQRRLVKRIFKGMFSIERTQSTDLRGAGIEDDMPGMVYYLTRDKS